ncbi:carboxylesterase 5A, partial [Aphomia sociella]
FDTVYNASDSSVICPQVRKVKGGILQCLRLNIFVPNITNINQPVPVFVWFHGGGFVTGSGGEYDGKHLSKHGVIVVTVNYRLGPYGFFCLRNSNIPGNQGLKDQVTALKWIKENIGAFGGNPDEVTIAGESYGGGAVDLHLYSNNEKLFSKAIIQSGSAEVPAIYKKPDYDAPRKLAQYLDYNTSTTKKALKFLATVDPIVLSTAANNINFASRVCKEKHYRGVENFITKDPFHLSNNKIEGTPILIGYNSKENFKTFVEETNEFFASQKTIFYDALKNNFNFKEQVLNSLAKIVQTFYMGNKTFSNESMLELVDFSSDFILNHAAESSINRYMKQGAGNVYKYLFSYVGGSSYKNVPGVGAYHTEELKYLFGPDTEFSEEQILIKNRMTKMWTNFVKYGDPTPELTALLPVSWTPVKETRPYMDIDVDMQMQDYVYRERMAFWDLFWQSYKKKAIMYN